MPHKQCLLAIFELLVLINFNRLISDYDRSVN